MNFLKVTNSHEFILITKSACSVLLVKLFITAAWLHFKRESCGVSRIVNVCSNITRVHSDCKMGELYSVHTMLY